MHLSQVKIQNFRNLKDITVNLRPGLNVLVGANNSGKTNFFDAIRHALGPTASRSEPLWLSEEDIYRDKATQSSRPPIRLSLTFSGLDDDDRAQFFEIIDFGVGVTLDNAPARLNFEAIWNKDTNRFKIARWGGDFSGDRSGVPSEILAALPLIFLPALRDAEAALTPGNQNILARVLDDLASRDEHSPAERLEDIFAEANRRLEEDDLVKAVEERLHNATQQMAGTDYTSVVMRATPPDFRRILRTLRLILDQAPVADLSAAGLGYSNILFIATILSHLEQPIARECPVLLLEEPEAHLSPQLTVLLADYLSKLDVPQVVVNTHSPTFAAHVNPSQVHILAARESGPTCQSLYQANFSLSEERKLKRMLDITRATLYFAKGLLLVEGISEALLLPELAKLIGVNLANQHISVLPICGVSFPVFAKMFSEEAAHLPVAILSDADPTIMVDDNDWRSAVPSIGHKSARLLSLEATFKTHTFVRVFSSKVTLEYDLAEAGSDNPKIMTKIWESTFTGNPRTLNSTLLHQANTSEERALCVWRGICQASHSGSKADFANELTEWLVRHRSEEVEEGDAGQPPTFKVPQYIDAAIRFVTDAVARTFPSALAADLHEQP